MDKPKKKKQLNKYIQFSGLAIQMGVTIGLFTVFGVWLDKKFPNNYSTFTVIFSLIGVFAALYSVIKQIQQINKEE